MNYPREAAIRVMTRVLSDRMPLDQTLDEALESVSAESRAWLQENCSGVLRWKGRLDLAVDSVALSKKPSGWLRKVLLLAAYQLCAQDRTSASQVVSETVSLVKRREGEAPARFANAALRKIADHANSWRTMAAPAQAEGPAAAAWASLPPWLWTALVRDHGLEWATQFAQASLERPTLWVRARTEAWSPIAAGQARAGAVPGAFQVSLGGPVSQWPGFQAGEFFVQDISSQKLVAEISAEVRARSGDGAQPSVLDLCAAPGGKSMGLSWSGMRVTASDIDERRINLLEQNSARAASGIRVCRAAELDALSPQDLVWVDAPCSGTGIIRRHPDVRWLRQEKELAALQKTQVELIQKGWSKVRVGGLFAYSVCSVLKDEGPRAWERAQRDGQLSGEVLRTWSLAPHLEPQGDGFWAVLVVRTA